MTSEKIRYTIFVFLFGLSVGGFFAVAVVREAVPLSNHVWAIGFSLLFGIPIIGGLVFWHLQLIKACRKAFGPKGGEIISHILSYQVVSMFLVMVIVISIMFAAIA